MELNPRSEFIVSSIFNIGEDGVKVKEKIPNYALIICNNSISGPKSKNCIISNVQKRIKGDKNNLKVSRPIFLLLQTNKRPSDGMKEEGIQQSL